MPLPTLDQVREALARVDDPEIRRPITELGMVRDVAIGPDGRVAVTVDLTTPGCPLKETITRDVTREVGRGAGRAGGDGSMGVLDAAPRQARPEARRGGDGERETACARPRPL